MQSNVFWFSQILFELVFCVSQINFPKVSWEDTDSDNATAADIDADDTADEKMSRREATDAETDADADADDEQMNRWADEQMSSWADE